MAAIKDLYPNLLKKGVNEEIAKKALKVAISLATYDSRGLTLDEIAEDLRAKGSSLARENLSLIIQHSINVLENNGYVSLEKDGFYHLKAD